MVVLDVRGVFFEHGRQSAQSFTPALLAVVVALRALD